MKRDIIRIDEAKCDGCGLCAAACAEGAIKIVGGKARLVSDSYCDGLGACLADCPRGALTITQREAADFDEEAVRGKRQPAPGAGTGPAAPAGGCPSARAMDFGRGADAANAAAVYPSALSHWPVQLRLLSPSAACFKNADVVLAADCVAYALGGFHERYLRGRRLAIACPKLDAGQDESVAKLRALIDDAGIKTLTVVIMQVPCCAGLLVLARRAMQGARRRVPVQRVIVGLQGDVLSEGWLSEF